MNNDLRELVWETVRNAAGLAALGYVPEAVLPNYSPDSPAFDRFIVLRWGPGTPGIAPAHTVDLQLWVYDRQPDYGAISDALRLLRPLLLDLPGTRLPEGRGILGCDWGPSSADLYDDAYNAYVRSESYALTASGN
jgi:hypothetical protein